MVEIRFEAGTDDLLQSVETVQIEMRERETAVVIFVDEREGR